MTKPDLEELMRKARSEIGRIGGAAGVGKSKIRSSQHYQNMAKARAAKRKRELKEKI